MTGLLRIPGELLVMESQSKDIFCYLIITTIIQAAPLTVKTKKTRLVHILSRNQTRVQLTIVQRFIRRDAFQNVDTYRLQVFPTIIIREPAGKRSPLDLHSAFRVLLVAEFGLMVASGATTGTSTIEITVLKSR